MGIHVNSALDRDQRICRQISFYDLVELMMFGRLSFNQSSKLRIASLNLPLRDKKMMAEITTKNVQSLPARTAIQTSSTSAAIAYQSWTLLEHDRAIDWGYDDASAPSIHIVSTIRALAESLFVSEDLEVFIDRTSRLAFSPPNLRSERVTPVRMFDDGTLTVTIWPKNRPIGENQHLVPRLSVDLKTLLGGALVSPKAPTRFVELISDLVQRNTRAKVSRASWSIESAAIGTVHVRGA